MKQGYMGLEPWVGDSHPVSLVPETGSVVVHSPSFSPPVRQPGVLRVLGKTPVVTMQSRGQDLRATGLVPGLGLRTGDGEGEPAGGLKRSKAWKPKLQEMTSCSKQGRKGAGSEQGRQHAALGDAETKGASASP